MIQAATDDRRQGKFPDLLFLYFRNKIEGFRLIFPKQRPLREVVCYLKTDSELYNKTTLGKFINIDQATITTYSDLPS